LQIFFNKPTYQWGGLFNWDLDEARDETRASGIKTWIGLIVDA